MLTRVGHFQLFIISTFVESLIPLLKFDVLNIIESATVREDIDRFVQLGEDAMFALKRLIITI